MSTTSGTPEFIRGSRERIYRALREADPQRYRDAINTAEAVVINHGLPPKAAVDVEAAVVLAVAAAIGVKVR